MSISFSIPWHRYALIAHLAKELEDISPQFGKTALQKIVFLLQEMFDVPIGYRFTLYNYGPYSSQLTNDLSMAEAMDAVTVSYVQGDMGGYRIRDKDGASSILAKGRQFITEYNSSIQRVIEDFGEFPAKRLELYTTIFFVARDLGVRQKGVNRQMVSEAVSNLKPYFSGDDINDAIRDLSDRELINLEE